MEPFKTEEPGPREAFLRSRGVRIFWTHTKGDAICRETVEYRITFQRAGHAEEPAVVWFDCGYHAGYGCFKTSQGTYLTPAAWIAKELETLLYNLARDAELPDEFDFNGFVVEFGYEKDAIKAMEVWTNIKKTREDFLKLLGPNELAEYLRITYDPDDDD